MKCQLLEILPHNLNHDSYPFNISQDITGNVACKIYDLAGITFAGLDKNKPPFSIISSIISFSIALSSAIHNITF